MNTPFKRCPKCGQPAVLSMPQCRRCGHTFRTQFSDPNVIVPMTGNQALFKPFPARDVSRTFTTFFGCFYFIVNGWWKSAIVAFLLCILTGGLAWIPIAIFAPSFVESFEGKSS